jgi:feruloyl esterase
VLRQCDRIDGQLDGLVDDPRRCRFATNRLACGTSSSPDCFSPEQISALDRIYAGYRDRKGRWTAVPYLPAGSEVSDPMFGWDRILFAPGDMTDDARAHAPVKTLDGRPIANLGAFDFDRDPARFRAVSAYGRLDPSTDLRRFLARGGKLILWHGWADTAIPPQMVIDYYEQALRASGPRAASSIRLFMIPGMQHGFGGKGADLFGQLMPPLQDAAPESNIAVALQAWVETGRDPASIVAKRHSAGATEAGAPPARAPRERLLCAYPNHAMLTPGANPDNGSSYVCRR